jgi:hypothetical protein
MMAASTACSCRVRLYCTHTVRDACHHMPGMWFVKMLSGDRLIKGFSSP